MRYRSLQSLDTSLLVLVFFVVVAVGARPFPDGVRTWLRVAGNLDHTFGYSKAHSPTAE